MLTINMDTVSNDAVSVFKSNQSEPKDCSKTFFSLLLVVVLALR